MAKSTFTDDDDALLSELGVDIEVKKAAHRTPREERIISGFEEIQKFVEDHGRVPSHGEDKDIFERLYATRLDQIRKQPECRELVTAMDHQGLLDGVCVMDTEVPEDIDDDELLLRLGVSAPGEKDITQLRHVKPRAEVRAAEDIANRTRCEDFDTFKPIFEVVQKELDSGARISRVIRKDAGFLKSDIRKGEFFILGGQVAYVASVGEPFKAPNGQFDARLRVIYSNSTESDILLRSLQRAIYKDETSRMISEPMAGPLFSDRSDEDDVESGTIYVLRRKSDLPAIAKNREVIHKIGVTGGKIETRIANAKLDPTFLLADVEIVATYELYNINRSKLENLLHRFFASARLDIEIEDRFGTPVKPREWFLVPLNVIGDVVSKIQDGSISDFQYDIESATLALRDEQREEG